MYHRAKLYQICGSSQFRLDFAQNLFQSVLILTISLHFEKKNQLKVRWLCPKFMNDWMNVVNLINLQGVSKYKIYICKFCIYCHPANSKFTIWHILLLVRIYTYTFKDKIRLRLNTSTYMYIYPPSSLFVRKLLDRVKPPILHTH